MNKAVIISAASLASAVAIGGGGYAVAQHATDAPAPRTVTVIKHERAKEPKVRKRDSQQSERQALQPAQQKPKADADAPPKTETERTPDLNLDYRENYELREGDNYYGEPVPGEDYSEAEDSESAPEYYDESATQDPEADDDSDTYYDSSTDSYDESSSDDDSESSYDSSSDSYDDDSYGNETGY